MRVGTTEIFNGEDDQYVKDMGSGEPCHLQFVIVLIMRCECAINRRLCLLPVIIQATMDPYWIDRTLAFPHSTSHRGTCLRRAGYAPMIGFYMPCDAVTPLVAFAAPQKTAVEAFLLMFRNSVRMNTFGEGVALCTIRAIIPAILTFDGLSMHLLATPNARLVH